MQIFTTKLDDKIILQIKGRFDFNSRHIFKDAYTPCLQISPEKTIELEMSGVEYLDSSSLGMIMLLSEKAQEVGKTIVITHPNQTVVQVLDIANIAKVPNIVIES
ncbi:MAG: STAS domain-containing protein [Gallionellaceae bacterium]|jgi:anti-anti-sigma factor